jgi:O-Antigen ligase
VKASTTLTGSIKGFPGWFMPVWCITMPITSFLVVPSVQGTIPAYMMAFASAFFVVLSRNAGEPNVQRNRYLTLALTVAGMWLLLLCGSQLGHLLSNRRDFGDMFLINTEDTRVVFRTALFTQSLYFAACLCIALFFRFFFRAEWMRYVLWGGWFLALYGIYEWLFFFIFHEPGDFIVNRAYGGGAHTASWSQVIQIGSFSLLRIKSTYGEPSWFAAGVVPYLFLALENNRKWLTAALLFCLIFSTSSSAYAAFPLGLVLYSLFRRRLSVSVVLIVLLFAGALATLYYMFPETYEGMFTAKLSGENNSGQSRQESWQAMADTEQTFTLMNRVFGIGFGYCYSGVFYALLVNTGWIGMAVYFYAFLKPVILLRSEHVALALKVAVATLFFLFYISVSELFLPTTWMFLGLAYWQLDQQKYRRSSASAGSNVPDGGCLLRTGQT